MTAKPETAQPAAKPSWYRRHWPMLVFIAVGVVAIAILIAALVAFTAWKSSPEKALLDAAITAKNTPATYKVTAGGSDLAVRYGGTLFAARGTYGGVPIEAVLDSNMLYVRSDAPDKLVALVAPTDKVPETTKPFIDELVKRIGNQWVSVPLSQLTSDGPSMKALSCGIAGSNQLASNSQAWPELAGAYVANPFFTATRTEDAASESTLAVAVDDAKLDGFLNALADTRYYGSLKSKCSNMLGGLQNGDALQAAATVVVSEPGHKLRSMTLRDKSQGEVRIVADYAPVAPIIVPSGALSYDSLAKSITQSVITSLFGLR